MQTRLKKVIEVIIKSKSVLGFVLASALLIGYILFFPPMPGVADQGDFARVMSSSGLNVINRAEYDKHPFKYVVVDYKMEAISYERYLMLKPATSQIYPILVARLICQGLGLEYFSTRVLAFVLSIIFIISMTIIYSLLLPKQIAGKVLLAVLLLFMFYDSNYIVWFNSIYGEPIMLVSLAMFISASLVIINKIDKVQIGHFIFLGISVLALVGSKLQCIVLLPVVLFFIFRYSFLYKKRYIAYVASLILIFYSVGFYNDIGNNFGTNKNTLYHSLFFGLLIDSPDPKGDLLDMGLNPDLVLDKGKHSYLPENEYVKYYPNNEITQKEFYSKISNFKILKFYLTHPINLYKGLQYTATNAYDTGTSMGKYEYGGLENYDHQIKNHAWSYFRHDFFPTNLIFILSIYLLGFIIAIYEWINSKGKYLANIQRRLKIELFLALLLIGVIQYPMPYILNGHADVAKQLYLFNISFDILIFSGVYYLCSKVYSRFFIRASVANISVANANYINSNNTKTD